MSASTVSITANPTATRRRPVEKRAGLDLVGADSFAAATTASPSGGGVDKEASGGGIGLRAETVLERPREAVKVRKTLPNAATVNGVPARRSTGRKGGGSGVSLRPERPRWKTVVRVLIKNLLLLLAIIGLVQMVRKLAINSAGNVSGFPYAGSDIEGRIAEMEGFLKKTTKMMQVQVEVVDRKIENEVGGLRRELGKKIDDKGAELGNELKKIEGRTEKLENYIAELRAKDWLSKEDFDRFFDEFNKAKGFGESSDFSLDEVRAFAREVVEKEIEKHAADGLGRVDYAVATGGAMVVMHSEPLLVGKGSGSWFYNNNRNAVHSDAVKMLRPSFGEPGQCFALKGNSGFVEIRLRTAIVPEAITLEHVAQSVAYDRSSAPKHCRVYGWLQGQDSTDPAVKVKKQLLLTEFTYDLEKSNAQTFIVLDQAGTGVVDSVRLDFTSNHGSPTHTCIYRLRVHGYEPNSVSIP